MADTAVRTHAERRAAALEVFERFTNGEVDAERAQRSMERRLGALGTFAFDVVMGDVWARPQLSRRDRSLIVITVLATIGSSEELSLHTEVGLNHGLTRTEIEEILLQVAAYAGFPMAMAASRVVDDRFRQLDGVDRLPERIGGAELDDDERERRAVEVRQTLTAGRASTDPASDMGRLVEHLGEVGRIAYHWAFGDVWSREELSRRDRSIVVISILTALSRTDELAFHVPAGLNHGLTRTEIEEIMVQLTIYGGIPRAVEGTHAMKAAFAKVDARS
ncbi:carboxymuconolactone decarboxylase family protein [Candidatus Poriferisodalis sp.]|uniref:carboxymuconolactone decarboxylase family protein n=1 Tax=Candidatus Poriferisodalis sp. TaxID=3101277 RepID=UPI003D09BD17